MVIIYYQVIEHLCLVNKLSEKGHDTYLAETTLILYQNNTEKVRTLVEIMYSSALLSSEKIESQHYN